MHDNNSSEFYKFTETLYTQMDAHKDDPIRSITEVLGSPLDYNPRRAIRTLNNAVLLHSLLRTDNEEKSQKFQKLFVELILSSRFSPFYDTWIPASRESKEKLDALLEKEDELQKVVKEATASDLQKGKEKKQFDEITTLAILIGSNPFRCVAQK